MGKTNTAPGASRAGAQGFKRAERRQQRLRLALSGPAGSGKTYTALIAARVLAGDGGKPGGSRGRIAVIDTEHGSASLYADEFEFDVLELVDDFHPDRYIAALRAAEKAGYAVVVIDSLTHAWKGPGGVLALHDAETLKKKYGGNSFRAWAAITPIQDRLIEAVLGAGVHVIATMRTKTKYVVDKDEKSGRTSVKKLGLAPVQREDTEYEFDIWGEMSIEHDLEISKSRMSAIEGVVVSKPGAEFFQRIRSWLEEGLTTEDTESAEGRSTSEREEGTEEEGEGAAEAPVELAKAWNAEAVRIHKAHQVNIFDELPGGEQGGWPTNRAEMLEMIGELNEQDLGVVRTTLESVKKVYPPKGEPLTTECAEDTELEEEEGRL